MRWPSMLKVLRRMRFQIAAFTWTYKWPFVAEYVQFRSEAMDANMMFGMFGHKSIVCLLIVI